MLEVRKIKVNDYTSVHLEEGTITIYKNGQLRCSGFEDSINYLEFHCYFNDISDREAFLILEEFQSYYVSTVLQKTQEERVELTELLSALHNLIPRYRYYMQAFRKLNKNKQFRNNCGFWKMIFDIYFDAGDGKVGRLASRILLRNNLHNRELWETLTEFYNDISYRKAIVKKILSDIKKYREKQ